MAEREKTDTDINQAMCTSIAALLRTMFVWAVNLLAITVARKLERDLYTG